MDKYILIENELVRIDKITHVSKHVFDDSIVIYQGDHEIRVKYETLMEMEMDFDKLIKLFGISLNKL
jgi:hypothetical protein